MTGDFEQLLRLRFDERNRQAVERFTAAKQQLNARGLLHSSETIREMHRVAEAELRESAAIIVGTAIDLLVRSKALPPENELRTLCSDALAKRKGEVEALYLSQAHHVEQGLTNKTMIQPYKSLNQCYALQREEITLSLASAFEKHLRDRGGNLVAALRSRFLNRPMVAWAALVIAAIVVVAAFAGALRTLHNIVAGNG